MRLFYIVDDHSRVILKTEQNANDYINANYIEARTLMSLTYAVL